MKTVIDYAFCRIILLRFIFLWIFRVRWHKSQIMGYSSQRLYFYLQRPQWDRYLPQIQPRWPMGGLWWRRRCSQGQYIRTLRSPFHYLFIAKTMFKATILSYFIYRLYFVKKKQRIYGMPKFAASTFFFKLWSFKL